MEEQKKIRRLSLYLLSFILFVSVNILFAEISSL